jgi:hypothetical protein
VDQDWSAEGIGPEPGEAPPVDAAEFRASTGEALDQVLDPDTWTPGENLADLSERLYRMVEEAVRQEDGLRAQIRKLVFERLATRPGAPKQAGVYEMTPEWVERTQRGLLFNGGVEACDGTSAVSDRLPLTITQLGVCLVSYHGDQGSWVHRLYRRDLQVRGLNPVEEALELLERRRYRGGLEQPSHRDQMSELLRRGIMTYAERAVLLKRSHARWRMGHGNPTPFDLLTGSGTSLLVEPSLKLLSELVLEHQRFVFIPSAPADRMLITIGDALHPLEYAIVDTQEVRLRRLPELGGYRGDWRFLKPKLRDFANEAGPQIAVGVYRASSIAPAQVFYAHIEHAHTAAHIAIADSVMQEHKGFPMLIDLADTICRTTFGGDSLGALTELAYVEAGAPFRYIPERHQRT